jgi:hypothetical protein
MSETKSPNEPLFEFRYLRRRMIVTLMGCLILMPIFVYALFADAGPSTFKLVVGKCGALVFLAVTIPAILDMLLLKEIRLYKHKIVKVWNLIGVRELELARVGLRCQNVPELGIGKKGFFRLGRNSVWCWIMDMFRITGISYNEQFADPIEVRKLNILLAELSGRSSDEFEQTVTMKRLIKDGVLR